MSNFLSILSNDSNMFSLLESTSNGAINDLYENDSAAAPKKKRLATEERIKRSRERNRIHARKTRERKKLQMNMLEARVQELRNESLRLRQLVDERYTADLLVVLSSGGQPGKKAVEVQSSATLCGNTLTLPQPLLPTTAMTNTTDAEASAQKRMRRRGKYTPQEREKIRRERNRMHAKKTRDKKKTQFDQNEAIILELEKETRLLRNYLVSMNLMSSEEASQSERHENASKAKLAMFKVSDADDETGALSGEEEDSMSNDGTNSNDGSNSHDGSGHNSNDDESAGSAGTTSGESGSSNKMSSAAADGHVSNSSASDNFERSESCGSGSGGDSPPPMEGDERADGSASDTFVSNYGPSKPSKKSHRQKTSPRPAVQSESLENQQLRHDAQSGLYGPSKQAHDDARVRNKQQAAQEASRDLLEPI